MREIEFRAKTTDNKWHYGFPNVYSDGSFDFYELEDNPMVETFVEIYQETKKGTLGQYTGLKDKNGKKIYEGDICLCNRHIADSVDKRTFEIIFDGSWMGLSNETYGSQISYEEFDLCEVIGNIYDNPELLTQNEM